MVHQILGHGHLKDVGLTQNAETKTLENLTKGFM